MNVWGGMGEQASGIFEEGIGVKIGSATSTLGAPTPSSKMPVYQMMSRRGFMLIRVWGLLMVLSVVSAHPRLLIHDYPGHL